MATKPAGASAYGDISNTRKYFYEEPVYRGETVVQTPSASYTVDALIALINTAIAGAAVTDAISTGKAGRTENYAGAIATLDTRVAGSGYTNGTYTNVPLLSTEGIGEGALANITVSGGGVTAVTLVYGGKLYAIDDTLTAATGIIGAGTGFTIDVATLA